MTLSRIAWAICGVSVVFLLAAATLYVVNFDNREASLAVDPYTAAGSLASAIVGALILSRHPRNALGWLLLPMGLSTSITAIFTQLAVHGLVTSPGSIPAADWLLWVGFWAGVPAFCLSPTLMLLLFPSGRLEGRPTRIVAAASVAATLALMLNLILTGDFPPGSGWLMEQTPSPVTETVIPVLSTPLVGLISLIVCSLASVTILLGRLVRTRGVVRQQLKWVVYAMAVVVAANALDFLARLFDLPIVWATGPLLSISTTLIPVSIGVAILRYRLFDIDRLVSRTLVYGSLTAGLAAIYLGGVLLFQRALHPVTSGSSLAVAGTTLLVAALARPLRNRVQRIVDRRFYRRHYDAAAEIARFAARLREQTDLTALEDDLRRVVNETMQPSHVSLWVRDRPQAARQR